MKTHQEIEQETQAEIELFKAVIKKEFYVIETILTDRIDQYGTPKENFFKTQSYWQKLFNNHTITAGQVALGQILLKISRAQTGKGTIDTYRDIIGYALIAMYMDTDVSIPIKQLLEHNAKKG